MNQNEKKPTSGEPVRWDPDPDLDAAPTKWVDLPEGEVEEERWIEPAQADKE